MGFGRLLYARIVRERGWSDCIADVGWQGILACIVGGLIGMLVHPNMADGFRLSWTTIVDIGLLTPMDAVPMGQEWSPVDPSDLVVWFRGWVGLCLLGAAGLLFAPRRDIGHAEGRVLTSVLWLVAVLVVMTLKSVRVVEYLAPVVALFCGMLWSTVDVPMALRRLGLIALEGRRPTPVGWVVAAATALVFMKGGLGSWTQFHQDIYADDVYATTTRAIAERARPGDRVLNARWDDFPMLYRANPGLRYVSGLDPVLFHAADPDLSKAYNDLTFGSATPTREQAWEVIHGRLGARFVFISTAGRQLLLPVIEADPRYRRIADSADSAAFELAP
jgi:hypothetical protein